MTKADIITRIYEKIGFSKKDATDVVESTFDIIKGCLEKGEKVKISGFGNFVVNTKRPRKGRNPQTGDEIIIEPNFEEKSQCHVSLPIVDVFPFLRSIRIEIDNGSATTRQDLFQDRGSQ